jgi:hypothetical protein
MSLSPMIVIGCGGSGGKVVLNLRKRLEADLRRRGWEGGIPDAWQLKWIDVPTVQESHLQFGAALKPNEYIGLAVNHYKRDADSALMTTAGMDSHRLTGWRPSPGLSGAVSKLTTLQARGSGTPNRSRRNKTCCVGGSG